MIDFDLGGKADLEHKNTNVNEINSSGDENRVAQAGRDVDQGDIIHEKLLQRDDEMHGTKMERQEIGRDLIHGGQHKTVRIDAPGASE